MSGTQLSDSRSIPRTTATRASRANQKDGINDVISAEDAHAGAPLEPCGTRSEVGLMHPSKVLLLLDGEAA